MAEKIDTALWQQCLAACPRRQVPAHALPFRCKPVDGNRVLIVNGDLVKLTPDHPKEDKPHMDFVEGGNDLEATWVKREYGSHVLLLDDEISFSNWPFILLHEAVERRYMAKGMSYNAAHVHANAAEKQVRMVAMRGKHGR